MLKDNKEMKKSSATELAAKDEALKIASSLTAQCAELKRVGEQRAAELEAAKKKEAEMTAQLEGLKTHTAEVEKRAADSAAAPKEADKAVVQLTADLQAVRDELAKAKASHSEALTSLQEKLEKSEGSILEKTSELSKLVAEKDLIAIKADEAEASRVALAGNLEAFRKETKDARAQILGLKHDLVAAEKALADAKEAAAKKATAMTAEMQEVEAALGTKRSDFDATKANLAATTTAYSALSAQHNQLKAKTDLLTQQLEAEVQQTQERKLKVRAYVDNLNLEKKEMETVKQGLVEQLGAAGARISALEAQLLVEEQKLKREEQHVATTKQTAFLEQEQLQQEHAARLEAQEGFLIAQKKETARLQGLLDEHARATAEEVRSLIFVC
jgi:chromosome segregation ATPase